MGRPATLPLVVTAALLAVAPAAPGQQAADRAVEFSPRPDQPEERRLARFIDAGDFRLWERDTTLARSDTVPGDVLVVQSEVRLEGRIEGTLASVDGDVFLRPSGSVGGDLLVFGGGMYRSSLATVDGELVYEPNLLLEAVPHEGGYAIHPVVPRPDPLKLDGLSGLHLPVANRVDGWSLAAGGRVRAVDAGWQPSLHVAGVFRTAGARLAGTARQYWYPTARWRVGVEGGRRTRTMDRWIRSDAANTLTYVFGGDDYRNYHESDRLLLSARRQLGGGDRLELRAGWERIRPLPARGSGTLFGDGADRPNPPVDRGDAWTAELTARLRHQFGRADSVAVNLGLEGADASVGGDFSYLFAEADLDLRAPAALGHRVRLEARGRGDLAGELPRHRWSAIGGAGTLPALDLLELRGERLLYGRVTYRIPIPVLRVPRLGGPELLLRAATGTVWEEGEDPDWRHSLSAGARFLVFEGGLAWDPGEDEEGEVRGYFTVRIPR